MPTSKGRGAAILQMKQIAEVRRILKPEPVDLHKVPGWLRLRICEQLGPIPAAGRQRGYIRLIPIDSGSKGGRPSVKYEVNPNAFRNDEKKGVCDKTS